MIGHNFSTLVWSIPGKSERCAPRLLSDSAVHGSRALLKSGNDINDRFSLLRVIGIRGPRSQEYVHRNFASVNPGLTSHECF